jgi:hypothetical protein
MLLRFVVLLHRHDDISLFLPCFDIAMSFAGLPQRVASIDDGSNFPRLNQLFGEIRFSAFSLVEDRTER